MAENWIAYMGKVEDEPASFIVDLDAGENYDLSDYPMRIELTLPFEPGPTDGLPDDAMMDRLNSTEDRCVEAICGQLDAVHVGHATRPGRRWVLFYAPAAANLEEAAQAIVRSAGARDAEVEAVDDAEWDAYYDFLFPTQTEFQWFSNSQLVEHLESEGDALTTPRQVDHAAYFAHEQGRDAFAAAVAALGFTLGERDKTQTDGSEPPDELPYSIEFTRTHAVDMETITEITMPLVELAAENDGLYDGWATELVKK